MGSNPAKGIVVRLFCVCVLCRIKPQREDNLSFRGVLSGVCLFNCMCYINLNSEGN